jgi:glucose-6-phosphate isomerase
LSPPSDLVERIWERDSTVWTGSGESHWLGWLDAPAHAREQLKSYLEVAQRALEGVDDVVLLGMGGSSLAPEVLRRSFGCERFHVLDTTHPLAVRSLADRLDPATTLVVAASKSGGTIETRSHLELFWKRAAGLARPGDRFLAITDPGSGLDTLARERGFVAVVAGEPTIGGRYSALSPFGLVPAALMGIAVDRLLATAEEMRELCRLDGSPGLELGLALGAGWAAGRDKVCIPASPGGFGLWVEQLVAESTGKQGKGLVPAPGEHADGPDRQLAEPSIATPYDLGAEFFRWEFATAVAGALLGINPFDQPDVQAAKDRTSAILAQRQAPDAAPLSSLDELLAQARPGDYVAIQAFVDPTPAAEARIEALAGTIRARTGLVVTHGLGPRYLHSTGQLHKGGPNTGLFLQVVDDVGPELAIPGQQFGFGRLITAQAAGDLEALRKRGRRVARVRLEETP